MTKLDDAIYNLSKIYYYEIMDFFNNRDEAFFFFRTTPFKLDKNGKYIKTQLIIELLYNMLCKTKLYTLCVHLITAYVKEASTVYSSTQNPRKSLTCGFKVSNTSGTGEL